MTKKFTLLFMFFVETSRVFLGKAIIEFKKTTEIGMFLRFF